MTIIIKFHFYLLGITDYYSWDFFFQLLKKCKNPSGPGGTCLFSQLLERLKQGDQEFQAFWGSPGSTDQPK